jgi:hypothetical protein
MVFGSPVGSSPIFSNETSEFPDILNANDDLDVSILKKRKDICYILEINTRDTESEIADFPQIMGLMGQPIMSAGDKSFGELNPEEKTFYFSNGLYYGSPYDEIIPNLVPLACVTNPGLLERSITVDIEETSRASVSSGSVAFADGSFRFNDNFLRYNTFASEMKIYVGRRSRPFKDFFKLYTASMDLWHRTHDEITIPVNDREPNLDNNFSVGVYTGDGKLGGDTELFGRSVPFLFGRNAFNITPVLINKAHYIYQVSGTRIQNIHDVMDQGLSATNSGINVSTYSQLVAIQIPPGTYATCNDLGIFKVNWAGGSPEGLVTCTASGLFTGGSLLTSVYDFISWASINIIGFAFDYIDLLELNAFDPYSFNFYYDGSFNRTNKDVLDEILKPFNGVYYLSRKNRLVVKQIVDIDSRNKSASFVYGAKTEQTIISIKEEENDIRPIFGINVAFNKNYTPMNDDQISQAVAQSKREELKRTAEFTFIGDIESQFKYPSSVAVTIDSKFSDSAGAYFVALKQLNLRKDRKRKFTMEVGLEGLKVEPGDIIEVKHPLLFKENMLLLVYRVIDKLQDGIVEIGAYG